MKKKIYSTKHPGLRHKKHQLKNIFACFLFIISISASAQNPLLLKSPIPGGSNRAIDKIIATSSGKTFFNTVDNNNHFSDLWGLWVTDGTQAGTTRLSLTSPGFTSTEATYLAPLGDNKIVFAGDDENGYGEVWVSDGTQAGTFGIEKFTPGGNFTPLFDFTSLGTMAVYTAIANNLHLQLRKTDGTIPGTSMLHDFGDNSKSDYAIGNYEKIGNTIYFELINSTTTPQGFELWRTDGTTAGTYQVKDFGQDYSIASNFMAFNNNIYFITNSTTYGDYIWKSDGTNAGTSPLKQISTSTNANGFPSYSATSTALYFAANNSINGKELWKTNGTATGTFMLSDINPGPASSGPNYLVTLNDVLYFSATNGTTGDRLWKYDMNSGNGPVVASGATGNPDFLTLQNNTILFSASSTLGVPGLWVTDGTAGNTVEFTDINPYLTGYPDQKIVTVSGNSAYFIGYFDTNGDGIKDPCIYKYTVPEKIWTGSVSSDASIAANWFPAGAPAQTDNVLLPINAANPFSNPFLFCNDFINNGSTVNVGTGLALINGNLYNAGTINNNSGGVFAVATGATTSFRLIGGPGTYNGQFTLSGGVNARLTSNFTVNHLRIEGDDSIYLGPYNLQIDALDLKIPKIFTDSAGKFFMPVGASPVSFPIVSYPGASFTPVTITNTGTYDYFGVNVKDGVYSNGTTGNLVGSQVVNKTWNIEEQTPGGSNATVSVQWSATDELPGFVRNSVYLNHYTSSAWDPGTPGTASGSGPFTFSRSGITSFSPFTISSSTSALPVNLISFTADKLNNAVQLNWQTMSEKNFSFFEAERSNDGIIFSRLGEVPISFNNSTKKNYSYTDNSPITGTNFYRLKMVDADAKFTYSKTVALRFDGSNNALQIFPNPAKDILHVQVTGSNENAVLQIVDLTGRKLKEQRINVDGTTSVSVDINDLPKGMYNLLLKTNSKTEHQKFVKQ